MSKNVVLPSDKDTHIELTPDGKIIKYRRKPHFNSLAQEAEIQKLAHSIGIAPEIYSVTNECIVMEYIKGLTLDEYMKTQGPNRLLKPVVKSLLINALHKMYSAGIIHRDLTGRNVIVTTDSVKIIDYGNAQLLGHAVPMRERDTKILKNRTWE